MTKRIFRSMIVTAGAVLLATLVIIMGCLYEYFCGVQEQQLKDELSLAVAAMQQGEGEPYLQSLNSDRYRLTWVAADGTVLYDTRTDAETMENHAQRQEIQQALLAGQGESSRYSSTLLEKTLYQAQRLEDGSVLRISISRATAGRAGAGYAPAASGGAGGGADSVCAAGPACGPPHCEAPERAGSGAPAG